MSLSSLFFSISSFFRCHYLAGLIFIIVSAETNFNSKYITRTTNEESKDRILEQYNSLSIENPVYRKNKRQIQPCRSLDLEYDRPAEEKALG